jgi:D-alanyl-D-alanine carboxypeptidase
MQTVTDTNTDSVTVTTTTSNTTAEAQTIVWPNIDAQSAFIYDPVGNIVLFEKDADTQRSMASLLKLMTAATTDNILSGAPKLAEKPLSIVTMKDEAPSDFALPAKSTWLPSSLMDIMLLGSSNKAAETLASGLIPRSSFMSLMNFNAKRLGLTQTYFRNPTGLTELSKFTRTSSKTNTATSTAGRLDVAAGVSTAREVAKLMWAVIAENPGLLDITARESITIPNKATPAPSRTAISTHSNAVATRATSTLVMNTNKILKDFPIMFGKTGFTENSGGNLAVVLQKSITSHPYVIVVLGSTQEKRFEDVAKLASTTLALIDASGTSAVAMK